MVLVAQKTNENVTELDKCFIKDCFRVGWPSAAAFLGCNRFKESAALLPLNTDYFVRRTTAHNEIIMFDCRNHDMPSAAKAAPSVEYINQHSRLPALFSFILCIREAIWTSKFYAHLTDKMLFSRLVWQTVVLRNRLIFFSHTCTRDKFVVGHSLFHCAVYRDAASVARLPWNSKSN